MIRGWLVLALGLCAASLGAFPLPPALEIGHLVGKGRPSGAPPIPVTDELYALGWGPDGAFSTLERRWAGGGQQVRLRVYDLVEDVVLWEKTWPDWKDDQDGWWAARGPEVDAVFARFKLEPVQFQLGVFPLIYDEDFYRLTLRLTRNSDDPTWIERLELSVVATGRGIKTVSDRGGLWRWATLVGFVPSPYEGRVALVFLVQPAGWGGENQPIRYLISGLSLKAGFAKP